jgi:hypothetical protein
VRYATGGPEGPHYAPGEHDERPDHCDCDHERQHGKVERLGGAGQDRLGLEVVEQRIRLQLLGSRPQRAEHLHHVHRDHDTEGPAERGRKAIEGDRRGKANRRERAEQDHAV